MVYSHRMWRFVFLTLIINFSLLIPTASKAETIQMWQSDYTTEFEYPYVYDMAIENGDGRSYLAGYGYYSSYHARDCFVVQFSAGGNFNWTRRYGGNEGYDEFCHAIDLGPPNDTSVYLVGYSNSDPYGSGTDDGLIIKYNSNGDRQWVRYLVPAQEGFVNLYSVLVDDEDGTVYLSGGYQHTEGTGYVTDCIVASYDPDGNENWRFIWDNETGGCKIIGSDADDIFTLNYSNHSLLTLSKSGGVVQWYEAPEVYHPSAVMDSDGNLILSGQVGYVDFQTIIRATKIDPNGNVLWTEDFDYGPTGLIDLVDSIAIGNANDLYIKARGCLEMSGIAHLIQCDSWKHLVLKYNADGEFQWIEELDGFGNGASPYHYYSDFLYGDIATSSSEKIMTISLSSVADPSDVILNNLTTFADDGSILDQDQTIDNPYFGLSHEALLYTYSYMDSDYVVSAAKYCVDCYIDGECYPDGTINPDNSCQICDSSLDAGAWSSRDGETCDDGVFCNGADTCDSGACSQHAGDPCDTQCQSCNEGASTCDDVSGSCDDGLFCNGADTCDSGACSQHAGDPCDAQCQSCNEGASTCDDVSGSCDDGVFCNGADTCDSGACSQHAGDPCNDDLYCNGEETCDEENDLCVNGDIPCPDDGLWCTGEESCDEENDTCVNSGDPCDPETQTCNEETDTCDANTDDDTVDDDTMDDDTSDDDTVDDDTSDDDTTDDDTADDDAVDDDVTDDDATSDDDDDDDDNNDGCGC